MSRVHFIDGCYYVEVKREAIVGDFVVKDDILRTVTEVDEEFDTVMFEDYVDEENDYVCGWGSGTYRVLEPLMEEDAQIEVTDLIANLARRVASLEQQLADAQRNIERMGYEQSEAGAKVEMLLNDIVMLDERTQTRHADVVTFDKFLDSVADKVAERLIGGGRQ